MNNTTEAPDAMLHQLFWGDAFYNDAIAQIKN